MRIVLQCEAFVTRGEDEDDEDGGLVTDPAVLASFDGEGEVDPGIVQHMDGHLAEIGLTDGGATLRWDGSALWTRLVFHAPRKLTASELALLKDYLWGQLLDGWGTTPYERDGLCANWVSFTYNKDRDVTITQVDGD